MKNWNITIKSESENEALKLLKLLTETFTMAAKYDLPLDHIYADVNGTMGDKLICERIK